MFFSAIALAISEYHPACAVAHAVTAANTHNDTKRDMPNKPLTRWGGIFT